MLAHEICDGAVSVFFEKVFFLSLFFQGLRYGNRPSAQPFFDPPPVSAASHFWGWPSGKNSLVAHQIYTNGHKMHFPLSEKEGKEFTQLFLLSKWANLGAIKSSTKTFLKPFQAGLFSPFSFLPLFWFPEFILESRAGEWGQGNGREWKRKRRRTKKRIKLVFICGQLAYVALEKNSLSSTGGI